MSAYVLNLFGGFDLRDDQGAEVTIRSKKGRCLLAYLAIAQGGKVGRDELAALLWGDRGDTQARRSLNQELYRLRGLFPEDMQGGFVMEAESVALGEGLFEVDAANFERGLDSGDAEAAALYTGDLLAGQETGQEGFDEWLRGQRERLREHAVTALHEQMRADLDGAPDAAANAANRILALDPASEEAHRALMQLHAQAGRRDLALRQYEKCREVLARQLDIEPDGATTALYEQIKSAPAAPAAEPATEPEITQDGDALALPSKPSIAVLPFDNMSGDAEQEYFSDGIADDIITGLSRFRDLFVIARNSSFTYKGRRIDIKQVGAELGVRYVLEGGVRKAGNRVRITAQLVEAESGNHLWAEKYDGELSDIFDLQDEIAASVLGTIQPTVFLAETERARRRHPANLDAYEMCMKGWAHEVRMDRHSLVEARSCFQTAIDLDAGLAQAYSGLAGAHIWEWALRWSDDPGQSMAEAVRAAQRAVAIDEADEAAHVYVGMVSIFSGQLDAALKQLDRAIELNPNSAIARCVRSWAYSFDGRPDEGVKEAELALRSSPRDWFRFGFLHGLTLSQYMMRDYAAASETAMKLVALKPDYLYGHAILAMSCAQLGQSERAHAAMRDTLRLQPTFDAAFQESIAPCRDRADLEHLKEGLRKAGWEG